MALVGVVAVLAFLWSGFTPGGGGADELPAEYDTSGNIKLRLRVSVWGGGGSIQGRYTDMTLQHRPQPSAPWRRTPGQRQQQDATSEVYAFVITRAELPPAGDLEYTYEVKLDGQPTSIAGKQSLSRSAKGGRSGP